MKIDVETFGRMVADKISRSLAPPEVYFFVNEVGVGEFVRLALELFEKPELDSGKIPAPVLDFLRGVLTGHDEICEAMSRHMHEVMPPQAFEMLI